MLAGVHTTIGTDGEGVEHTNMRGEYKLAHTILEAYQSWEPAFLHDTAMPPWAKRYHRHIYSHDYHIWTVYNPRFYSLRYHRHIAELREARGKAARRHQQAEVSSAQLLRNAQEHAAWMAAEPHR